MTIEICRLGETAGAEVRGLDMHAPWDQATRRILDEAFLEHLVLVFQGNVMTPQAFMAFARNFGALRPHVAKRYRHPEAEEIVMMTNVDKDGNFDAVGASRGVGWHSDLSYDQVPAKATALHALELPDRGGDTRFANMYLAYESMPDDLKRRITGLKAEFRYGGRDGLSRGHLFAEDKAAPSVIHPVVRLHPETGRPAVYVNPYHALRIVGMPEGESDALLDEVFAWCDRPEFEWRHRWRVGDTVVWENRSAWHSATLDYPHDQRRIFMRATVCGTDTAAETPVDRLAGSSNPRPLGRG